MKILLVIIGFIALNIVLIINMGNHHEKTEEYWDTPMYESSIPSEDRGEFLKSDMVRYIDHERGIMIVDDEKWDEWEEKYDYKKRITDLASMREINPSLDYWQIWGDGSTLDEEDAAIFSGLDEYWKTDKFEKIIKDGWASELLERASMHRSGGLHYLTSKIERETTFYTIEQEKAMKEQKRKDRNARAKFKKDERKKIGI